MPRIFPLLILSALPALAAPLDGLVTCYGFDRTLLGRGPGGNGQAAQLSRKSRAFDGQFRPVFANEPVFAEGKFGGGILVAPGCESKEKHAFQNLLPPAAAELVADGREAWHTVGDASWRLVQGNALQGDVYLAANSKTAASGIELAEPVESLGGDHAFTFYARQLGGGEIQATVLDAEGKELATKAFPLTDEWQRFELLFAAGTFTRDRKQQTHPELRVRLTGAAFDLDALQLEFLGGYSYAGARSASLWQPGHAYRQGDVLSLPDLRPLAARMGTIAFWCQPRGKQRRRILFEIPTGNRWEPVLQLALMDDKRWTLSSHAAPKAVSKNWDHAIEPDSWHHVAVGWRNGEAAAWVDGERVLSLSGLDWPTHPAAPRLGSAGPNAAANAVIDECAAYNRLLDDADAQALAQRNAPLDSEFAPGLVVRPERLLHTISRTQAPQPWRCTITNPTRRKLRSIELELRLGPVVLQQRLSALAPGETKPVAFALVPDLTVGTYPLLVRATCGGLPPAELAAQIEITRSLAPYGNLQVAPWGWNAARKYGFTIGGGDVEDAMRDGLAHGPLLHYLGYPRTTDGRDQVVGMNGTKGNVNVLEDKPMRAQLDREGERIAKQIAATPSDRALTLNSEMQWIWSHDFSPERKAFVKRTFGLDLNPWENPPGGKKDRFQDPFGRLKPSVAGFKPPENRVIPIDSPLYAYHRWFHGVDGPTESLFNQTIADHIQRYRPDFLTIWEPILRRCAVRAFDRIAIGQEWFYYENPMNAVLVQERLNTATRGTRLRPTGMPQFLFKKGRAAPYAAVATADMFHETVWLCALQPIRMLTYWNFNVVPDATFENYYNRCYTKAQIDELFGTPTPTWEQAEAVLKANPKARKLMPWTPELIATFARFHNDEIGPLAALIPRWRNHPRRVAMVRSFASQLYGEVRWPKTSWLENCAVYAGLPFDVLWDEDFEQGGDPLDNYDLVIVSQAACLTEPGFRALSRFAKRGGTVVVDAETKVEIPGAIRLEPSTASADFEQQLAAKEEAVRKQHGDVSSPQYIEAMEGAAQLPSRVEPAFLALVQQKVQAPARSLTPNTWLNLLDADGVHYLGVVNDLRTRGPMYGHFGKVRETGVPQTATVRYNAKLGTVVYDVLNQQRLAPVGRDGDDCLLELPLPAAGALLLLLTEKPVGKLELDAKQESANWSGQKGRELRIRATLRQQGGKRFPGLVPALVTIQRPDGTRDDFSRAAVFSDGRLELRVPLPRNLDPGPWTVSIQERASGTTTQTVAEP
jgi:hypothetical protein